MSAQEHPSRDLAAFAANLRMDAIPQDVEVERLAEFAFSLPRVERIGDLP